MKAPEAPATGAPDKNPAMRLLDAAVALDLAAPIRKLSSLGESLRMPIPEAPADRAFDIDPFPPRSTTK